MVLNLFFLVCSLDRPVLWNNFLLLVLGGLHFIILLYQIQQLIPLLFPQYNFVLPHKTCYISLVHGCLEPHVICSKVPLFVSLYVL